MKVLMYEVGKEPKEVVIADTLKAMQKAVGGYIETLEMPNGLWLVCNEEGKIQGLPRNKTVLDKAGEVRDVIMGDFFICRDKGDEFASVRSGDKELANEYLREADDFAEPKEKCVICGSPIYGFGNNPWPLAKEGRCCDACNELVILARIADLYKEKGEKK